MIPEEVHPWQNSQIISRNRISRPLLDRLDLLVEVPKLEYEDWRTEKEGETSASIRSRVGAACRLQQIRFQNLPIRFNSQMSGKQVRELCPLGREEEAFMKQSFEIMGMSPRQYDRIIKVARTIADLEGEDQIREEHLSEAVFYRSMTEKYWGVAEL